jgi:peptide deformylase
MSALPILEYPDPQLRSPSSPVSTFDHELKGLVDGLLETLYSTQGVAFSAPQTGHFQQVLVLDLSATRTEPEVYINPEILMKKAPGIVQESCLSVPGVAGHVVRATQARVRARDPSGALFERTIDGLRAVCVQHEMDHFDGTLFIDRLFILQRLWIRAKMTQRARRVKGGRGVPPEHRTD